jgi:hypothetical protein
MSVLVSTIAPLLSSSMVSHPYTLHTFAIDPLQLRESHMQLREIHIALGEDVANASDQKRIGKLEERTWFLFLRRI